MRNKAVRVIIIIAAALAVILLAVWFIPMPAGLWGKQEMSAGYTGAFQKNNALDELGFISLGGYTHPETVLVRDDVIYATVKGGKLVSMREDGSQLTKLLDTGGCLLGFDFDKDGNIIAVDCDYDGTGALLRVDGAGKCETLLNKSLGCELFYPNAVAIASDGTIYFTDSTTAFPPVNYNDSSSDAAQNEALMHTQTGRVIAYNPDTKAFRVLCSGMAFSNGIALSPDEKTLFVNETYAYAVRKVDVDSGKVSPFIENIPGFPDNLTKGEDGLYWVGLNGGRSDSLDAISDKPLLRKIAWILAKLSPAKEDPNVGYCHVFSFTPSGEVTSSLQSGSNAYYRSTGAAEAYNRIYIQSINDSGKLGFIKKPEQRG